MVRHNASWRERPVVPNGLGGVEAVDAHTVNQLVRNDITELLRDCCRVNLRQVPTTLISKILQSCFEITGM